MQIHPLTGEGKTASKAKLSALRAADTVRRETAQAKNDLESYILKVSHTLKPFEVIGQSPREVLFWKPIAHSMELLRSRATVF